MTGQLNWFKGGIVLAIAFLAAVILVKPTGVSTQFVIFDAMVWSMVWSGLSDNLLFKDPTAKSSYARSTAYPG